MPPLIVSLETPTCGNVRINSGFNFLLFTFRYYSATILQMAGVRDVKQAIWLTAATSGTNFAFTLVGVWLVERVGRRKLTLGSLFGALSGCCPRNLLIDRAILFFCLKITLFNDTSLSFKSKSSISHFIRRV